MNDENMEITWNWKIETKTLQIGDKAQRTAMISEILAASVKGFGNKWENEGVTKRNAN